jgi:hypothetical protein
MASAAGSQPVSFRKVKADELRAIKRYRATLKNEERPSDARLNRDVSKDLRGLACSGGGIRSATFHLGVLQAFATSGLLPSLDIVSAVSGGGYIASWFSELCYQVGFRRATDELTVFPGKPSSAEIQHLRRHASYLTPRLGMLSHDVSFFIVTYLQNLCFNLLVVGLLLCVVMLAPRLTLWVFRLAGTMPFVTGVLGIAIGLGGPLILLLRLVSLRGEVVGKVAHRWLMAVLLLIAVGVSIQSYLSNEVTRYGWVLPLLALPAFFWPRLWWRSGSKAEAHIYWAETLAACVVLMVFFGCIEFSRIYPEWRIGVVLAALLARHAERRWEERKWSHLRRMMTVALPAVIGMFLVFVCVFSSPPSVVYWDLHFNFNSVDHFLRTEPLWLSGLVVSLSIVTLTLWFWYLSPKRVAEHFSRWAGKKIVAYPVAVGLILFVLIYSTYRAQEIFRLIEKLKKSQLGEAGAFVHVFAIIAPASVIGVTFVVNLILAIVGRAFEEHKRERVAEISSKIYIYALVWICVAGLAFYFPLVLYVTSFRAHFGLLALWAVAIIAGFVGDGWLRNTRPSFLPLLKLAHGALPYIFLLGFMGLCSWVLDFSVFKLTWEGGYYKYMSELFATFSFSTLVLAASAAALSAGLAARFGINMSAMHVFYRGRLAQAFLQEELSGGASLRPKRRSSDRKTLAGAPDLRNLDDLVPAAGKYDGPFLILNASMNLARVPDLAWQERKAANFIFSPLYCGFHVAEESLKESAGRGLHSDAYCRTSQFGYGGEPCIRLAMAMAISGSALGSNMGRYTSASRRFMNTVFNVRLGWWLNNPRYPGSWGSSFSRARLRMLIAELFGRTDASGPFVNLSDGGHFDNSGLYELVRRRCRAIVVVDGTADPGGSLSSFAHAVELCRTDFGAEINIDMGTDP